MGSDRDIWAVVPVKETFSAKQRLSGIFNADIRQRLALTMLEDVLTSVSAVPELSGLIVVTLDGAATAMARRFGASVWTDGARDGHTGAVMAAARRLGTGGGSMLTLPGDIPLVTPADISAVVRQHRPSPSFTIAPARDELGSNTIVMSPADLVPLRFGPDSYFPHLDAARRSGAEPTIVERPGIGLDIDEPADLDVFMKVPSATRTRKLLDELSFGLKPEASIAVAHQ